MTKQSKPNLVATWLRAIHLPEDVVGTFEAAGIVQPSDLAELQVCHYPALGVTEPGDRKKLFYLVQRVKMAFQEEAASSLAADAKNLATAALHSDEKSLQKTAMAHGGAGQAQQQQLAQRKYLDNRMKADHVEKRADDETSSSDGDIPMPPPKIDGGILPTDSTDSKKLHNMNSNSDLPTSPSNIGTVGFETLKNPSPSSEEDSVTAYRSIANKNMGRKPQLYVKTDYMNAVNVMGQGHITLKPTDGHNLQMAPSRSPSQRLSKIPPPAAILHHNHSIQKRSAPSENRNSVLHTGSSEGKHIYDASDDRSHLRKAVVDDIIEHNIHHEEYDDTDCHSSIQDVSNPSKQGFVKTDKLSSKLPTIQRSVQNNLKMQTLSSKVEPSVKDSQDNMTESNVLEHNDNVSPSLRRPNNTQQLLNANKIPKQGVSIATINSSSRRVASNVVNGTAAPSSSSCDNAFPSSKKNNSTSIPKVTTVSASQSTNISSKLDSHMGASDGHAKNRSVPSQNNEDSRQTITDTKRFRDNILKTRVIVSPVRLRQADTNNSNTDKRGQTPPMDNRLLKSSPSKLRRTLTMTIPAASNTNADTDEVENQQPSSIPLNMRISSYPGNPTAPIHISAETNGIHTAVGPVFVHGAPEDNSWFSHVATLREANQSIHQQCMATSKAPTSGDVEEMRIRVVVRKRPMSRKESARADDVDVIHPLQHHKYGRVLVYQPKTKVDLTREIETISFAFDNVYDENSNNTQIYNQTIRELIPGVFEGRWASIFAYGQTGSGKTFTMMGSNMTGMKAGGNQKVNHDDNLGLYYLAARDLFLMSQHNHHSHLSIGVSFFEIYGGKLYDLLNDRSPVKCLEDHKGKVCFPGLSEHPVSKADHLMRIIEDGNYRRSTGTTSANADSSRSHAVLQLCLRKQTGRKSNIEHGRLSFIDLAGSERGADTSQASRTTRLEGAEINTSLLALKEVIRALAMDGTVQHIPFRGSKLTQVLKESFVGKKCRTVMIACVAPNMMNCETSLNTLRYSDRVKERNSETGHLNATTAVSASRPQKKNPPNLIVDDRPPTASSVETKYGRIGVDAIIREQNVQESEHSEHHENELDHEDIEVMIEDEDDASSDENTELDDVLGEPPLNPMSLGHVQTTFTTELDEILHSPRHKSGLVLATASSESMVNLVDDDTVNAAKTLSKREVASCLVSKHRTVMSQMLSMVKQEMLLVNSTDADRELVDDYVIEIENMHEKQLSLISSLRGALVDYYARRPPRAGVGNNSNRFEEDEDELRSV